MMLGLPTLRLVALVVVAVACHQPISAPTAQTAVSAASGDVKLGDTVRLRVGESVTVVEAQAIVRFEGVVQDSRCPIGVTCVWEGDAVARFTVTVDGEVSTLDLHTHPNFDREGRRGIFTIHLTDVSPVPQADVRIDPKDYVAAIVLSRTP